MQIIDVIRVLEAKAPLALQESYDNAGLITGNPNWECSGILCTLDATEEVIAEAKTKGCNLVVAHHPIVFSGLKKINGKNYVEKAVIFSIKNDVAIYAIHTNLDTVFDGVNNRIADQLGLINRQVLLPKDTIGSLSNDYQSVGSGLLGELPEPLNEAGFLHMLKTSFDLTVIRHTPLLGKNIEKVAVCGGSGSFLIEKALKAGADIYISSDIKYHEFFDANSQMVIADIGHWESEQFTTDLLIEILQAKFPTFAVLKSGIKTNPVNYFIS
jgi:dinuclear metal center YbgI/SA1388 family protein